MSEPARGRCPVCTGDFAIRKDGMLWWHRGDIWVRGWRQACAGSGNPPRPTKGEP